MRRFVDKHPYNPNQCRNTNYAVYDTAGDAGRAKYKRNQIKAKYTNQSPIQGTNNGQWHQNESCQSSHLFFLLFQDCNLSLSKTILLYTYLTTYAITITHLGKRSNN